MLTFTIEGQTLTRTDGDAPVARTDDLTARFLFPAEGWEGRRFAVFQAAGGSPYTVPLDGEDCCIVPWEALRAGVCYASVYRTPAHPTSTASFRVAGTLFDGQPQPTPDIYERLLTTKADAVRVDGYDVVLVAEGKEISRDTLPAGEGGEGGVRSLELDTIRVLDQGEYEALTSKDPRTLYLIRG